MIVRGMIFSGVLRGQPLIDIYYHRLVGLIGFEPYKGTLDIKLERKIDFRHYSTKAVEHVLMDGRKMVNVWLAPVGLVINKNGRTERYQCWAMQEAQGIYGDDVVEIIAHDRIKEKFGVEDRDPVDLEFPEPKVEEKKSVLSRLKPPKRKKK